MDIRTKEGDLLTKLAIRNYGFKGEDYAGNKEIRQNTVGREPNRPVYEGFTPHPALRVNDVGRTMDLGEYAQEGLDDQEFGEEFGISPRKTFQMPTMNGHGGTQQFLPETPLPVQQDVNINNKIEAMRQMLLEQGSNSQVLFRPDIQTIETIPGQSQNKPVYQGGATFEPMGNEAPGQMRLPYAEEENRSIGFTGDTRDSLGTGSEALSKVFGHYNDHGGPQAKEMDETSSEGGVSVDGGKGDDIIKLYVNHTDTESHNGEPAHNPPIKQFFPPPPQEKYQRYLDILNTYGPEGLKSVAVANKGDFLSAVDTVAQGKHQQLFQENPTLAHVYRTVRSQLHGHMGSSQQIGVGLGNTDGAGTISSL
jgi:hypothetical protein